MTGTPLFTPRSISDARTTQLMRKANTKYNLSLSNYDEFWVWSTENTGNFWDLVWQETGIIGERGHSVRGDDPGLNHSLTIEV
jgi:acetoacetyl-CoA synthetase